MTWLKQKMNGQITISALYGVIILIAAIATPVIYVTEIKADLAKADSQMTKDIAIDQTNIQNITKQLDSMNGKLDALLNKQGISIKSYGSN